MNIYLHVMFQRPMTYSFKVILDNIQVSTDEWTDGWMGGQTDW